jgi:hypothetical protein
VRGFKEDAFLAGMGVRYSPLLPSVFKEYIAAKKSGKYHPIN